MSSFFRDWEAADKRRAVEAHAVAPREHKVPLTLGGQMLAAFLRGVLGSDQCTEQIADIESEAMWLAKQ